MTRVQSQHHVSEDFSRKTFHTTGTFPDSSLLVTGSVSHHSPGSSTKVPLPPTYKPLSPVATDCAVSEVKQKSEQNNQMPQFLASSTMLLLWLLKHICHQRQCTSRPPIQVPTDQHQGKWLALDRDLASAAAPTPFPSLPPLGNSSHGISLFHGQTHPLWYFCPLFSIGHSLFLLISCTNNAPTPQPDNPKSSLNHSSCERQRKAFIFS